MWWTYHIWPWRCIAAKRIFMQQQGTIVVTARMHSAPSCNSHSWPMVPGRKDECAASAELGALSSAVCAGHRQAQQLQPLCR